MTMLDAGTPFGAYTIEGFIAAGGMGEVYAARHEVYGSPVALKVLHADLVADADWRRRFNEEGLVGQQLKHPHVLAARELVESGGRVALVMDLVRGGQTLSRVISREFGTGLPLVQALQAILAVIQGVEYLHGKGVVHGDLKPENVMIQGDFRDPATWVPLVTDFGTVGLIAHPVLIDGQPAVVASPRYASPEHLLGVDRVEARSDLYAIGLLLHYLLTGRHASEARTVNEAAEVVARPIPLVYLIDQPEAVMALFRRATQVDPADRYGSCRELALAIRQTLDELGVKLHLEDLQADLATEVMEERAQMKQDQVARNAEPEGAEPVGEAASESAGAGPDGEPTELDLEDASPQAPAIGIGSPVEGPMHRGGGENDGPGRPVPRAPEADDPDDEPAVPRNPLWGHIGGDDDEDDLSEAPTARLGESSLRDGDATVKLDGPAHQAPSEADAETPHIRTTRRPTAPPPAAEPAPASGLPGWVLPVVGLGGIALVALAAAAYLLS